MSKRLGLWILGVLLSSTVVGCASPGTSTRWPDKPRVAVAPVQFLAWDDAGLTMVPPDEHLAKLMVTGLETAMREQGYSAAFAGGASPLPEAERQIIAAVDLGPAIAQPDSEIALLEGSSTEALFTDTPRVLFSALVSREADAGARLLWHPDTVEVTYHAFLVDTRTGRVISHSTADTMGNYRTIESSLRRFLWQRGKMSELVSRLRLD